MPQQQLMPWLVTAIVASVAGMVTGAHVGFPAVTEAAAGLFALSLSACAYSINEAMWRHGGMRPTADAAPVAARRNARLMAVGYAWAATAMFALYHATGLKWQHGWQYALAMALFAMALYTYTIAIGMPESPLRRPRALLWGVKLVILQGVGALVGIGFLLISGKILSRKPDWAANQIFLWGGLALVLLSILAVITQRKLLDRRG